MTNIYGQMNLGNYNYKLQQQLATMPPAQQQQYINYLYGTGASDEVIFNTYNSDGNYCTDGKDDGKIGFFSALGNAVEGIGKTIVNGVKGMFTGADGKFSLGKTIGSIAMAAACIAFPAVGLAACAVGGVMGAVQVGKGVYNAATAKTDADAKRAWENIGSGTFTVASSVVGAKASMGAVHKSAAASKWGSAIDKLDDTASLTQKFGALGKDMISSTRHNAAGIKSALGTLKQQRSDAKWGHDVDKAALKDLKATDKSANKALKQAGKDLKAAQKSGDATKIMDAEMNYAYAEADVANSSSALRQFKADHSIFNQGKTMVSNATGKIANSSELIGSLKNLKGVPLADKLSIVGHALGADGKAILVALNKGVAPETLIGQYGYNNVAQVINLAVGSSFADDAI